MALKFVSDVKKFNIYDWLVKKLGKEEKEQYIQNPFGGVAIREWKNGKIVLARRVEISFMGSYMEDELIVSDEYKDLVREIMNKVEKVETS